MYLQNIFFVGPVLHSEIVRTNMVTNIDTHTHKQTNKQTHRVKTLSPRYRGWIAGDNKQWYIYLLGDGMTTPTGTDQKPVHNGQLQNWLRCQKLPLSILCTDQCPNVTLDPWWDWGNAVLQGHCQNYLSVNIAKIYIYMYIYIFLQFWWGWIQLITCLIVTTVICASAEWDSGS